VIVNIYFVIIFSVCVCVGGGGSGDRWGKRQESDISTYYPGLYLEVVRKAIILVLQ
jgi:hypothetical protein